MRGECQKCDFYKDDRCLRAEKLFSTMTDEICLQKLQVMLLRDLCGLMNDFIYEDSDDENGGLEIK